MFRLSSAIIRRQLWIAYAWWQPKHVVFLKNKVRKHKKRCVKTDIISFWITEQLPYLNSMEIVSDVFINEQLLNNLSEASLTSTQAKSLSRPTTSSLAYNRIVEVNKGRRKASHLFVCDTKLRVWRVIYAAGVVLHEARGMERRWGGGGNAAHCNCLA
jgi:hypothetical protein